MLKGSFKSSFFKFGLFAIPFLFFWAQNSHAQICGNPGRDGSGLISGIVNTYYAGTASVPSGANLIPVGKSTGFNKEISAGDLVLVIQMQDASINTANSNQYGDGITGSGITSLGNSGKYEYVLASGPISGGNLPIIGLGPGNGLINSYYASSASSTKGQSTFQIIRVPQYQSITLSSGLTAPYWNGSTGGVLVLDISGNCDLGSANVSVIGKGFRGGGSVQLFGNKDDSQYKNNDFVNYSTDGFNGSKGEGIAGTPRYTYSLSNGIVTDNTQEGYPGGSFARGAPGNAGGGATDGDFLNNDDNSGGGGGSNQGKGGLGGFGWQAPTVQGGYGGSALPASPTILFMGGGGGAGSRNNYSSFDASGGPGGGIIMIRAGSVSGAGTLDASGSPGLSPSQEGGGGGGAGGSIMFTTTSGGATNLTAIALGGNGGNAWPQVGTFGFMGLNYHGPGGGGSGGLVYTNFSLSNANVLGGIHGTTTTDLNTYGSSSGSSGNLITNGTYSSIVGIHSGAECPLSLIPSQTNLNCNGVSSGMASASVSGGSSPYTYLWSTGATTSSISGLSAGNYTLVVTDHNGASIRQTFTITQPNPILISNISTTNILCYGSATGSVSITASGGTGALNYSIDNGSNYQLSSTFSNLLAGNYTLIVKDANGCTSIPKAFTLSQPLSSLTASITSQQNLTCFGANNGSATVTASGGAGGYSYSWNTRPVQLGPTANGLKAGTYSVTVKDANNCSITINAIIQQSTAALSATTSQNNISCNGNSDGSASVNVSGGTGLYSYTWNTLPVQNSQTITGLAPGNYTVIINDNAGWNFTGYAGIQHTGSVWSLGPLSAPDGVQTAFIQDDGSINQNFQFPNAGSYILNFKAANRPGYPNTHQMKVLIDGAVIGSYITSNSGFNTFSTQSFNVLAGSNHTISFQGISNGVDNASLIDAVYFTSSTSSPTNIGVNMSFEYPQITSSGFAAYLYDPSSGGCTLSKTVTITQPTPLSANISSQTNVSCFGSSTGAATVNAIGGSGPYSYTWNTLPIQKNQTATGLVAGNYTVTVKDANNCSVMVSVKISQPSSALSASINSKTDIACYGDNSGSATVLATGGSGSYTYTWNTNPVQTSVTATGLVAGNYSVTVKDANGCLATATVTIRQPASALMANITNSTNIGCFGNMTGSATVSVQGGIGPYIYSWNTNPIQTTPTAKGLGAGNYMVTIQDANNCTATATVTINQSPALSVSIINQTNINCFGNKNGSVTIKAVGGMGPYNYQWNTLPVQNTPTATGLGAGTYMVTITDANQCSITSSVTITQPDPLNVSVANQVNVSCFGNSNGSATVNVVGGTPPYLYSWNTVPVQTSPTARGLSAGNYTVTITDAGGCSAQSNITISQAPPIGLFSISGPSQICNGNNASLVLNGSEIGINYQLLQNGLNLGSPIPGTGSPLTFILTSPGAYSVLAMNSTCSAAMKGNLVLSFIQPPDLSNAGKDQYLCNLSTTTLNANAPLVGTGLWTEISGAPCNIVHPQLANTNLTDLNPGTYIFQWTITNGICNASSSTVKVVIAPSPSLSKAGPDQTLCNVSTTTMSANMPDKGTGQWAQVSGASSQITNPGSATTTVTGLLPGTYVYMWSINSGSCAISTSQVTLIVVPTPNTANAGQDQFLCNVSSTNLAANYATAGVGTWTQVSGPPSTIVSPNSANSSINGLSPGNYVYQWTISSGNCISSSSQVNITVYPLPTVSVAGPNQNLCNTNSTSLNGNNPINGVGVWTQVKGAPVQIASPNNPNTRISGLSPGTFAFKWTISNGSCTQSSSYVKIVVSSPPDPSNAGNNQNLCNVSSANLSGNIPQNGTGLWTQISGPSSTIVNPSANNSAITGLTTGTYMYQWSVSNGACMASSSQVSIKVVNQSEITQAGPNQNLCNVNTANLSGNIPASGQGLWTQVSGPPSSISQPNSPNTSVTGLTPGTFVYQWTISNSVCLSSSSQVTIWVNAIPDQSNAGQNQNLCFTASTHLAGNVPVNGIGLWTQISGPKAAISDPNLANSEITGLIPGTYQFQWTISNGTCNTHSSTVTLVINSPTSLSNAGPNQRLLSSTSDHGQLFGNTPDFGKGLWTQVSGPNSIIANPSSPNTAITGLVPGSYVYQWTISNGNCNSNSSRVTIVVPQPLTATIINQTHQLCTSDTLGTATVGVIGGNPPYTYQWNTSPVQTTAKAINLIGGTYKVLVTDSGGISTTVSVSITQLPPILVKITNPIPVISPLTLDLTNPNITRGSTSGLSYTYFLDSLGTQVLNHPSAISQAGTYYIKGTNINGCSAISPVIVQFSPPVLPVPFQDSDTGFAGGPIIIKNILDNDQKGVFNIDPSSIDLDPNLKGIQKTFSIAYEGEFSVDNSGQVIFLPAVNFSGIVQANYSIADIYGNRSIQTATLNLVVRPKAGDIKVETPFNTSGLVKVLDYDSGNLDPASLSIANAPKHGKILLDPKTGEINYTPQNGFIGLDSLTYWVNDFTAPKALRSNIGTLFISVLPPEVDLSLIKKAPAEVNTDTYQYTFVISNLSPDTARELILTDTLPTGMEFIQAQTPNQNSTYSFNSTSNVFVWSIPILPGHSLDSMVITVNTHQVGIIKNTAFVKALQKDPNPSNNISSVSLNKMGGNLYFPTLFTPNGDGINDGFIIKGLLDYPNNQLNIYNRWGNPVYQVNGYMQNGNIWNGDQLIGGTYYYILKIKINGGEKVYGGYITLIR